MPDDTLAADLGEIPAREVSIIAKAASEEAAKWLKRNNIEAGAGTLAYAGALLKISTSSDQRTRTGIFILIASGGTIYIDPLSSKVIASDKDALVKLHQQAAEHRASISEYVELLFTNKIKLPQQFGGPATSITRTLVEDAELSRFISTSHVDKRALAAINNAVYQALLDKIVVGERPREEIMRLVDELSKPRPATATILLVALYSKVSGADPDLQERAYVELARAPLLAGGFGRESEQVLAEFKQLWHAVMWLNERRSHKAKSHHELHQLLLEFIGTLDASIRERVRRESEALLAARRAAAASADVATKILEVTATLSPKERNNENGTVRLNLLIQACVAVFGKLDERGETCSSLAGAKGL